MTHSEYMLRAISLARLGEGWCHPNPMVGAVIVKNGRVIGEGYHKRRGCPHAERNAIASLRENARGADMYVTLEPCCHYGKTPPCTLAILEAGISRVFVGSSDPNPKVAGKGIEMLRNAGVKVIEGLLKKECDALNPVFFHYITTKTPYVILKTAQTLDGKTATEAGASRWITGEEARRQVHGMRHACMAIMVGIGTVLADDPLLTCRQPMGRNPVRLVCDSSLRIPLSSQLVQTARDVRTLIILADPALPPGPVEKEGGTEKMAALLEAGVELVNLPEDAKEGTNGESAPPKVDLPALMQFLGREEIDSVLLEGGGTLNEAALRAGIVQEIRAFIAPKIFGGRGKSPVMGKGVATPQDAYCFSLQSMERFGEDVLLTYRKGSQAT